MYCRDGSVLWLQKLQKTAENWILYYSDGLLIQIEFSNPLCYLFGLVAVSRKCLSPFTSILQCVLLQCSLCLSYLSELTVFCWVFIF